MAGLLDGKSALITGGAVASVALQRSPLRARAPASPSPMSQRRPPAKP